MNLMNSLIVLIWALVILQSNILQAQSKLIEKYLNNTENWFPDGDNENLARFNSLHMISINEEQLNYGWDYSGKCDSIDYDYGSQNAQFLTNENQCTGSLTNCKFKSKTEARTKAEEESLKKLKEMICPHFNYCPPPTQQEINLRRYYASLPRRSGNMCKCMCHRTYNSNPIGVHGELVDSICYDPVSVDKGLVAIGVRFKRYNNVIYLQLKQGILNNNQILKSEKEWTDFKKCSSENTKPVIGLHNFNNVPLKVVLEDFQLPENAVLTGVTFGESVRGRYLTDRGNIDKDGDEIVINSQCRDSNTESVFSRSDDPKGPLLSISCNHHIEFRGISEDNEQQPFTIPYVDLREVVTNEPIRGVGWYHRGFFDHGGFLAVKVFIKQ